MNLKKVIPYVVFLGIGVFIFYKLMTTEDIDDVLTSMKSASPIAVFSTFLMGLFAVVSRGIRWKYLIKPLGYNSSTIHAIAAVAFGYLSNTVVPRSGEVARCAALNSTDDIPLDKLIGTVITERIVDFIMLFIFLAVAIITNLNTFIGLIGKMYTVLLNPSEVEISCIVDVNQLIDLLHSIEVENDKSSNLMVYLTVLVVIVGVFFYIRKKFTDKLKKFIRGVKNGVLSIRDLQGKGGFILHTIFIWVMYFLMSYSVFISMPELKDLEVFEGLLVMVSGGFGMVFPSPGGIGSYQYLVNEGFEAINRCNIGVAAGNVVWFTQTIMLIIVGAIGYMVIIASRNAKFLRSNK